MVKVTLKQCKLDFKEKNITLLATEYINNSTKMPVKCDVCENKWNINRSNAMCGRGCPACANKHRNDAVRFTLDDFKKICLKNNMTSKANSYTDSKTPELVECNVCKHLWKISVNNIGTGYGCPKCAGNMKLTIDDVKLESKKYGFTVIGKYVNARTKMNFVCSRGHKQCRSYDNMRSSNFPCMMCYREDNYNRLVNIVKKKGGILKTKFEDYENFNSRISLECKNGHSWKTNASSVVHTDTWCKKCIEISLRKNVDDITKILKNKNIICLDIEDYNNSKSKLNFKCLECNHIWNVTASHVMSDTGCPKCNKSKNIRENECRDVFEKIYNKKFSSKYPIWLKNPKTNRNLELDGYCEELKLAFEYGGKQHYEYCEFFHRGDIKNFYKQQAIDKYKVKICIAKGIKLIVIPYWENNNLESFIKSNIQIA